MRNNRKNKSNEGLKLSQIIIVIVFIPVICTAIITAIVSNYMEKKELITTLSEMNYTDAKEKSAAVNSLFQSMRNALKEVANQLSAVPLSDESTRPYVNTLLTLNDYFNYAYIVNDDGFVVQIVPESPTLKIGNKVTLSASLNALQAKKPFISEPYLGSFKKQTILLSHPIYDDHGAYVGFLAGAMVFEGDNMFHDILQTKVSNQTHSYSYVVNAEKRVLYHPDSNRFLDFEENNYAVDQVITGIEGFDIVKNSRGQDFIVGYAYAEGLNWGIITQTPLSYINERANRLTKQLMYVMIPCFLMLFIVSTWIANRLTLPLKQIMSVMSGYLSKDGEIEDATFIRSRWNYETNQLKELLSIVIEEVEEEKDKLLKEAVIDPMTGLMNRRDIDLSQVVPGSYAVILIDIDHFKSINDTYGHLKGDEVIVQLAQILQPLKREKDIFCRYGGEEFLLLLPSTDEGRAYRLAEGIRHVTEKCTEFSFDHSITISGGVFAIPSGNMSLEQMVEAADQALYNAKNSGRNRIEISR